MATVYIHGVERSLSFEAKRLYTNYNYIITIIIIDSVLLILLYNTVYTSSTINISVEKIKGLSHNHFSFTTLACTLLERKLHHLSDKH